MLDPVAKAASAFIAIFYNLPTPVISLIYFVCILFAIIVVVSLLMRLR